MSPKNYCPCCGYDGLLRPAYARLSGPLPVDLGRPPYFFSLGEPSYGVCPCCGFEYGFDDEPGTGHLISFSEYMREWLARGGEWFDATKKPVVWNLAEQLRNAGLRYPGIPVDGGGGD